MNEMEPWIRSTRACWGGGGGKKEVTLLFFLGNDTRCEKEYRIIMF